MTSMKHQVLEKLIQNWEEREKLKDEYNKSEYQEKQPRNSLIYHRQRPRNKGYFSQTEKQLTALKQEPVEGHDGYEDEQFSGDVDDGVVIQQSRDKVVLAASSLDHQDANDGDGFVQIQEGHRDETEGKSQDQSTTPNIFDGWSNQQKSQQQYNQRYNNSAMSLNQTAGHRRNRPHTSLQSVELKRGNLNKIDNSASKLTPMPMDMPMEYSQKSQLLRASALSMYIPKRQRSQVGINIIQRLLKQNAQQRDGVMPAGPGSLLRAAKDLEPNFQNRILFQEEKFYVRSKSRENDNPKTAINSSNNLRYARGMCGGTLTQAEAGEETDASKPVIKTLLQDKRGTPKVQSQKNTLALRGDRTAKAGLNSSCERYNWRPEPQVSSAQTIQSTVKDFRGNIATNTRAKGEATGPHGQITLSSSGLPSNDQRSPKNQQFKQQRKSAANAAPNRRLLSQSCHFEKGQPNLDQLLSQTNNKGHRKRNFQWQSGGQALQQFKQKSLASSGMVSGGRLNARPNRRVATMRKFKPNLIHRGGQDKYISSRSDWRNIPQGDSNQDLAQHLEPSAGQVQRQRHQTQEQYNSLKSNQDYEYEQYPASTQGRSFLPSNTNKELSSTPSYSKTSIRQVTVEDREGPGMMDMDAHGSSTNNLTNLDAAPEVQYARTQLDPALVEDTNIKATLLSNFESIHLLKNLDVKRCEVAQKEKKLKELQSELNLLKGRNRGGVDIELLDRIREWRRAGSSEILVIPETSKTRDVSPDKCHHDKNLAEESKQKGSITAEKEEEASSPPNKVIAWGYSGKANRDQIVQKSRAMMTSKQLLKIFQQLQQQTKRIEEKTDNEEQLNAKYKYVLEQERQEIQSKRMLLDERFGPDSFQWKRLQAVATNFQRVSLLETTRQRMTENLKSQKLKTDRQNIKEREEKLNKQVSQLLRCIATSQQINEKVKGIELRKSELRQKIEDIKQRSKESDNRRVEMLADVDQKLGEIRIFRKIELFKELEQTLKRSNNEEDSIDNRRAYLGRLRDKQQFIRKRIKHIDQCRQQQQGKQNFGKQSMGNRKEELRRSKTVQKLTTRSTGSYGQNSSRSQSQSNCRLSLEQQIQEFFDQNEQFQPLWDQINNEILANENDIEKYIDFKYLLDRFAYQANLLESYSLNKQQLVVQNKQLLIEFDKQNIEYQYLENGKDEWVHVDEDNPQKATLNTLKCAEAPLKVGYLNELISENHKFIAAVKYTLESIKIRTCIILYEQFKIIGIYDVLVDKETGTQNAIFHKELLKVFKAIDKKYGPQSKKSKTQRKAIPVPSPKGLGAHMNEADKLQQSRNGGMRINETSDYKMNDVDKIIEENSVHNKSKLNTNESKEQTPRSGQLHQNSQETDMKSYQPDQKKDIIVIQNFNSIQYVFDSLENLLSGNHSMFLNNAVYKTDVNEAQQYIRSSQLIDKSPLTIATRLYKVHRQVGPVNSGIQDAQDKQTGITYSKYKFSDLMRERMESGKKTDDEFVYSFYNLYLFKNIHEQQQMDYAGIKQRQLQREIEYKTQQGTLGILRGRDQEEEEDLQELDYYNHLTNAIDGEKLTEGFEKSQPKYTALSKVHHTDTHKDDCGSHSCGRQHLKDFSKNADRLRVFEKQELDFCRKYRRRVARIFSSSVGQESARGVEGNHNRNEHEKGARHKKFGPITSQVGKVVALQKDIQKKMKNRLVENYQDQQINRIVRDYKKGDPYKKAKRGPQRNIHASGHHTTGMTSGSKLDTVTSSHSQSKSNLGGGDQGNLRRNILDKMKEPQTVALLLGKYPELKNVFTGSAQPNNQKN